jgi:putative DNA methylase
MEAAGGIDRSATIMADLSPDALERVKTLAYRIYQICDRKGWTDDALAYNNLVATWGILESKAKKLPKKPLPDKPGELEF